MKFLKFTFTKSLFSSSKFITVGLISLSRKSIIKPSLDKIYWQKMDTQGYSLNYLCKYTVILTIANLSLNYLCVTFSDSVADWQFLGEFSFLSTVRGLQSWDAHIWALIILQCILFGSKSTRPSIWSKIGILSYLVELNYSTLSNIVLRNLLTFKKNLSCIPLFYPGCFFLFLSADSISSPLLVGLSGEEGRKGRLFFGKNGRIEGLEVLLLSCCLAVA